MMAIKPVASYLIRDLGGSTNYYFLKRLRYRLKKIGIDQFLTNSYLLQELLDIDTAEERGIKIICRRIDRHTCCADSFGIDYMEELE